MGNRTVITVVIKPEAETPGRVVEDLMAHEDVADVSVTTETDQYIHAHGLEDINRRAAEGWRVVTAWSYGAGTVALMERLT